MTKKSGISLIWVLVTLFFYLKKTLKFHPVNSPPYRFTDIKAFIEAEVRDLGRVTHTKIGITKLRLIP